MKQKKWIKDKNDNGNVVAVTENLLYHLEVPATNSFISKAVKDHPNPASIAAVGGVLNKLRVNNMTVQITPGELNEIAYPAVAHVRKNDNGYFVMLQGINGDQVCYLEPELGWKKEPLQEFQQKWSGIVLMADAEGSAGEKDYAKNRLRERLAALRTPFLAATLSMMTVLAVVSGFSTYPGETNTWLPLLLVLLAGTTISILLLVKNIDNYNPLFNKICNLGVKRKPINCNSILNSPPSRLFGWLSWSEIGAFYFTGSLLALSISLFRDPSGSMWGMLAVINLLALPYTFFSVYYQAFVVKQWCTLCTAIQILLWLELACLLPPILSGSLPLFNFPDAGMLVWTFLFPVVLWTAIKPGLEKSRQVKPMQERLNKFIKNPSLMRTLLAAGPAVETGVMDREVVLGDPAAPNVVTMAVSMYCGGCGYAFHDMKELVQENPDVKVILRFSVKTGDDSKDTNAIILCILAFTHESSTEGVVEMITDWYENGTRDFNTWVKNHPLKNPENMERAAALLEAHALWCAEAKIRKTPTLYINNRELPEGFYASDVRYFLDYAQL